MSIVTLFAATAPGLGIELWATDGTALGRHLVLDINPGGPASSPIGFTAASGGLVVFAADNGTNGKELWVTDGSTLGTRLLLDIRPGSASSDLGGFMASGTPGRVLFSANDGTGGALWVTDGTLAGTRRYSPAEPVDGEFHLLPYVVLTSTGRLTNVAAQTVSGRADAGLSVTVFDGANAVGTAVANGDGVWSLGVTLSGDGVHRFTAQGTDADGTTTAPGAVSFTYDTTPPAGTINDIDWVNSFAPVARAGVAGGPPLIVPTFSGTGEPGATLRLYDQDGTLLSTNVFATGTWSQAVTISGAEGGHTISGTLTDPAGNLTDLGSIDFIIDRTPANVAITSPRGIFLTTERHHTTSGTADPGTRVQLGYAWDSFSKVVGDTVVGADGLWSFEWDIAATQVPRIDIYAVATDPAGNPSSAPVQINPFDTVNGIRFWYDATPGVIDRVRLLDVGLINLPPSTPLYANSSGGPIVLRTEVHGNGTIRVLDQFDNVLGSRTIDSIPGGNPVSEAEQTRDVSVTKPSAEGTYNLRVEITDFAGNVSAPYILPNLIIDNTPPAHFTLTGTTAQHSLTNQVSHLFSGTGDVGEMVYLQETSTNGGKPMLVATVGTDGNWSGYANLAVNGPLNRNLLFTLRDKAGNSITPDGLTGDDIYYHLQVDAIAPLISLETVGTLYAQDLFDNVGGIPIGKGTAEEGALVTLVVEWLAKAANSFPDATHPATRTETYTYQIPVVPGESALDHNFFFSSTDINNFGRVIPGAYFDTYGEGFARLTFTATDAARNTSGPAVRNMVIDTTAPAAPTITNASGPVFATRFPQITINGTTEGLSNVMVFDSLNGGTPVHILTTNSLGTGEWGAQLTLSGDGRHTITTKAVDRAGNISGFSTDSVGRIIDTETPFADIL
jgi:ELWxxDGT repeat protein